MVYVVLHLVGEGRFSEQEDLAMLTTMGNEDNLKVEMQNKTAWHTPFDEHYNEDPVKANIDDELHLELQASAWLININ